jgi:hypothetical protein
MIVRVPADEDHSDVKHKCADHRDKHDCHENQNCGHHRDENLPNSHHHDENQNCDGHSLEHPAELYSYTH